jgi:hypothetical protein
MKYEEALDHVLDEVRAGRDAEAAIAQHPEYAARLRADAALARAVAASRAAIPLRPGAEERMQSRMLQELSAARISPPSAALWIPYRPWLFSGAAGLAAIVVIAVLVASGTLFGASTAEASFNGVVLENNTGTLTVQTSDRIETVTARAGAALADVVPGSFVSIQGKRQGNGTIVLKALTQAALGDWCDSHADQCMQLRSRLENQVRACQRDQRACDVLGQRLQELERQIELHAGRLLELESLCQQGNSNACSMIRTYCASHGNLCSHLKTAAGVATPLLTRLQSLRTACANDSSKCAQLRIFCADHADVCNAIRSDLQSLRDSIVDSPLRP